MKTGKRLRNFSNLERLKIRKCLMSFISRRRGYLEACDNVDLDVNGCSDGSGSSSDADTDGGFN